MHHDTVADKRTSHPLAILVDGTPRWARIGGGAEYHEDEALERIWRERQTMKPYYQDKLVTLYHGDCLDILPTLEPQSVDAVITDIPSGRTACAWDSVIPFDPMWKELKRIAKRHSAIVLLGCTQPFTSALVMSNVEQFRYTWTWYKNNPTGFQIACIQPMRATEEIAVFYREQCTYNPQLMKTRITDRKVKNGQKNGGAFNYRHEHTTGMKSAYIHPLNEDVLPWNVLEFPVVPRATGTLHPTQKPLALLEYLVKTYTNEGDTVLDFTSGSGTTLRACKNLGRRCVGIEMLEQYCVATVKRLAPAFEEAIVDNGAALDDLPLFAMEAL
jgi:site-specific DNA-methyltransferase (adenine-specific)